MSVADGKKSTGAEKNDEYRMKMLDKRRQAKEQALAKGEPRNRDRSRYG